MRMMAIVCLALCAAGCSPDSGTGSSEPQPKSMTKDIVDTMSQRNALEAGKKAGAQIRKISEEQNKDLEEVSGK